MTTQVVPRAARRVCPGATAAGRLGATAQRFVTRSRRQAAPVTIAAVPASFTGTPDYRPSMRPGSQVEMVGNTVTRTRLISSGTYQGIMA